MVHTKTHKRKTKLNRNNLRLCAYFCFGIMVAAVVVIILMEVRRATILGAKPTAQNSEQISEVTDLKKPESELDSEKPPLIDFQAVVDEWANGIGGTKSVVIYDLDRGETVGSYEPDTKYSIASIYKLFVVLEGYRRVQNGEWQAESPAGSTGYTIGKCLDLSIRESDSVCAETLWDMIGHSELDRIISDKFGLINTNVSGLTSTPRDVMVIMKQFYEHKGIEDEGLLAMMKDSFLNQPATEYDWRQGLPSGFSQANVYNKVGWNYDGTSWDLYHDAAIVEFPEQNRHYIVVVMTNQVPYQSIGDLGRRIESAFIASVGV